MKKNRAKYVIIGNSTAAVGAIEGIRGVDGAAPIVLVSKEKYHTYSRPLISYFLAGEIDEERMYYRPRDFYRRNNVEARLGVEALSVDIASRTVKTSDGNELVFDRLLIATGGKPIRPIVEGSEAPGVFTFTSWDDARAIKAYHEQSGAKKAVVVGGGLIGIKAAEALKALGLRVFIVELADRLLPLALDKKGAELATAAVRDAGVEIACGTTLKSIRASGGAVSSVILKDEREVDCDMVVMAIGVTPNMDVVRDTKIEANRGILVNDLCETSAEGIYAAGDVSEGRDALLGKTRPIPIFPNAYRQGFVAGTNMGGGSARVGAMFSMNSVEVFGLSTISVGAATTGDGYEVRERFDEKARTYRRVVLDKGRVVGALFVGDIDRAGIITGLIRGRVDVSSMKDLLLSDQFGLLSLPEEYRKHVVRGEGITV